ncbi:MAG TPA: AAA family ATPase [Clostridiales bacterium]|nr:AAA family ATPase [Clostridiales bacterium]
MHINGIEIKGFGKLKNRTFTFGRGLNVIYGPNEAGKSTMQSFITAMFYGLKGGRSSTAGLPSPLKRFMPWDGPPYGGAITYTLDNGDSFRLERDFSRNTVAVYDASYNDITPLFSFGRDKQPLVGETHLGMDEATFENTVFIRQKAIRLDSGNSSVLAARLVNMDNPDTDGLVYQRAETALNNAIKNRVGTERSRVQPLDRLQSELKRLEAEHRTLTEKQKEKEKLLRELSEIKTKLGRLELQEHLLAKIGELIETRKKIDEGMKKEARLIETAKQLAEIEAALDRLHSPGHGSGKTVRQPGAEYAVQPEGYAGEGKMFAGNAPTVLLILCAALAMISGVLLFAPGSISGMIPIPSQVYAAVLPVCVLVCAKLLKDIFVRRRNLNAARGPDGIRAGDRDRFSGVDAERDAASGDGPAPGPGAGAAGEGAGHGIMAGYTDEKAAALEAARRNLLSGVSVICGVKAGSAADVRAALEEVRTGLERLSHQLQYGLDEAAATAEAMDEFLPGFILQHELDELIYDSDINWLEERWRSETESLRRQKLDAALREKYCEGQLDEDREQADRLQRVEEEMAAVRRRIIELENTGKALKLALEVLTEAAGEIRLSNAPELNSRMSVIISGLTGGRYTDLRGDDKLLLKVSDPQAGDVRSVSVLSSGTADQMYLALRLATADMLTSGGESLPLVMDEVFSQFDDKRTEFALKYLYGEHRDRQILLFTCKMREVELVREIYGNEMYFVEL